MYLVIYEYVCICITYMIVYIYLYIYIDKNIVSPSTPIFEFIILLYFSQVILANHLNNNDLITYIISNDVMKDLRG